MEVLNSFIGYGNFLNAQIIFLGNEEGLGGSDDYKISVELRTKEFGQNRECWLDENNITNGFWEQGGKETEEKTCKLYKEYNKDYGKEQLNRSQFLKYCSRMILSLESPPHEPSYNWFQKMGKDDVSKIIRTFATENLYCKRDKGIETALIDWRPLPRKNEKTERNTKWPYQNYIEEKSYMDAFAFKGNRDNIYQVLCNERINKIKKILDKSKTNVLISVGTGSLDKGKYEKEKLLEEIFKKPDGTKIEFKPISITGSKPILHAVDKRSNSKLHIFISPYFNHQKYGIKLTGLKEFTEIIRKVLPTAP